MKTKKTKLVSDQEIRDLVIARLQSMSENRRMSIGSDGDFSKEELVQNVKTGSDVGNTIIQIQLNYLQSLKNGIFFSK